MDQKLLDDHMWKLVTPKCHGIYHAKYDPGVLALSLSLAHPLFPPCSHTHTLAAQKP